MAKKTYKALSDKVVAALPITGKAYEVFDKDFPRMWVAVGATGTKSFFMRVQIDGKRRKPCLGTHPSTTVTAARKKGSDLLDPTSHERDAHAFVPCPTVFEIFEGTRDDQVDRKIAKPVTWNSPYRNALKLADENMKKIGGLGFFERRLADISKRELVKVYKYLAANYSASVPQGFRSALTKMYSYAFDEGFEGIEYNIGRELQSVEVDLRTPKKRGALTWNALKLLWFWLDDVVAHCALSPRVALVFQIMAFTGLRVGAVRQLKHSDYQVFEGWLIVSPERDKTKIRFIDEALPKYVYLTPTVQELLMRVPDPARGGKEEWFFPSRVGRCSGKPIGATSIKWKGFFDSRDEGLEAGEKGYRPIDIERFERCPPPAGLRRLVPHELRHTVTTRAADVVRPKGLISRMLGHKGKFDTLGKDEVATLDEIQEVTEGYMHLTFFNDESYREELKNAWLQWDVKFRAELGLDKQVKPHQRVKWPGRLPHFKPQKGLRVIK